MCGGDDGQMATSFIRISSEADWPDNPIKCLMWPGAVWANTGLFPTLCSDYGEISMNLCLAVMVYSQSSAVLMQNLSEKITLIIFKILDIYNSRNNLFHVLLFLYTLTHN